jgi:hypothetical protein
MKPQEGIGLPSAPLRRGPAGPALDVQGTILNVVPVSTKYLLFINSSVKKMRPAFAGKCMAVAVACAIFVTELVRVWQRFSFQTRNTGKCTCVLCCHRNCETCTCHCPGFGKKRSRSRKKDDFWYVRCLVVLFPAIRSWASTALSRGSWDHGVVAA